MSLMTVRKTRQRMSLWLFHVGTFRCTVTIQVTDLTNRDKFKNRTKQNTLHSSVCGNLFFFYILKASLMSWQKAEASNQRKGAK